MDSLSSQRAWSSCLTGTTNYRIPFYIEKMFRRFRLQKWSSIYRPISPQSTSICWFTWIRWYHSCIRIHWLPSKQRCMQIVPRRWWMLPMSYCSSCGLLFVTCSQSMTWVVAIKQLNNTYNVSYLLACMDRHIWWFDEVDRIERNLMVSPSTMREALLWKNEHGQLKTINAGFF